MINSTKVKNDFKLLIKYIMTHVDTNTEITKRIKKSKVNIAPASTPWTTCATVKRDLTDWRNVFQDDWYKLDELKHNIILQIINA